MTFPSARALATSACLLATLILPIAGTAHGETGLTATGTASKATGHWIGAWEAAPSDASQGTELPDLFDAAANAKKPIDDSTLRAVLTPTYPGTAVRVRLSNRFGAAPVTFSHVTIAAKGAAAALADAPVEVTFDGRTAVTVASGHDVVSDIAREEIATMHPVAVSVYVAGAVAKPTEHFTARQTSYETATLSGDHTTDLTGDAFTTRTTTRPFVTGLEVRTPRSAGAIVALGDSITDGYQGVANSVLEVGATADTDSRWPDYLARRIHHAGGRLSVLNAGISGNRVLRTGTVGGGPDTYGISALTRLRHDVIDQPGVRTVIWLEGINDLGQSPHAGMRALERGWTQGIRRLHRAGLRVLLGTLTPCRGAAGAYGTKATDHARRTLNHWIRTQSPADGVVDFAAAVRDPHHSGRLAPAYDGGDHLHLNPAGYRAMSRAIHLRSLR